MITTSIKRDSAFPCIGVSPRGDVVLFTHFRMGHQIRAIVGEGTCIHSNDEAQVGRHSSEWLMKDFIIRDSSISISLGMDITDKHPILNRNNPGED